MRRSGGARGAAAALLGACLGVALSGCPETVDFDTGRFYVCTPDGGPDQCSTGWRCGLEGYCHPAKGGAWLCNNDGDCDGVWRCGSDGICINPTADALIPRTWPDPLAEPVSPRFVPDRIDRAAVSPMADLLDRCDFVIPPFNYPFCGEALDQSVSFAASGWLVQAMRLENTLDRLDPSRAAIGPYSPADGGRAPRDAVTWATLPFTPAAMAVTRYQTFLLDQGGRLHVMDASLEGGPSTVRPAPFDLPAPFAPNALTLESLVTSGVNYPLLVAYERGGTRMAVYALDDGGTSGVIDLPPQITGGAIRDVALWGYPAAVLVTTNQGVFLGDRFYDGFVLQDGGYDPLVPELVEMPVFEKFLEDGGAITLQDAGWSAVRTWVYERPWVSSNYTYMLVESVRGSGASAVRRVSAGGYDYFDDPPYAYYFDEPLDIIECDPGDVVAAVDVFDFGTDEELEVVCRQPGGGRPDILKRVRGVSGCRVGCQTVQVFTDAGIGIRMLDQGQDRTGTFDVHGRITFDEYGVGRNTLTMDALPLVVVGGRTSLEAWTASSRVAPATGTEHFVLGGAGLVQALGAEWGSSAVVGGVRGASAWRIQQGAPSPVLTAPLDGGRGTVFSLPSLSDLRDGPFDGKLLVVDGRPVVVASALDTLLSGQVGRDPQLQVRIVPNTRAAITSFDLAPAAPDSGVLLDGYAVAQARLFHITAETPLRWISSEVTLGTRGEPREVWMDRGRGRLALSDGRIYSLPSRVLLAPQLPDFPPEVSDFGFVCGHAFALGRRGLWRLDTSGAGLVGVWTRVDLDAVVAGAAGDPGWEGGKLHAVDEPQERALYVFTTHGNVARLTFDFQSCPD